MIENLRQAAYKILSENRTECDYIEYKKSAIFKDKIIKTICAYANNYMNREFGFLFIGIEEMSIVHMQYNHFQ